MMRKLSRQRAVLREKDKGYNRQCNALEALKINP
jgi:hypothetical protein